MKESCDTRLSTLLRSVSRIGVLCALAAMVPLLGGCPGVTPPGQGEVGGACNDDGTCTDNGIFCDGVETCNADNICESPGDPCTADQACNEDTGACDCTSDAGCDDGNACTTDTCDTATGACTNDDPGCDDGDDCTENDACDPDTGDCAGTPIDGCCAVDTDCDDANDCTDDVCNAGVCENTNNTAACDDGDACTTDDACVGGACVGTVVDCDDGLFCNGTETCDPADGTCLAGTDACAAGEQCDEDNDICQQTCTADADCDDGLFCNGTETCGADGFCASGADPCPDDGLFCTGTETCDEDTDACVSGTSPCAAGEACNESTDACDMGIPCTTDAECDDGDFCTGTESCGADGLCTATGDPCTAPDTCDEALNTCVTPAGPTVDFTLGTDNLPGTAASDTFNGVLLFNAPTGTNVPSVQTGDTANGGDGADVLNAQFNVNGTVAPTLTAIETLNLTDFGTGAITLSGTNITGATDINLANSTNTNVFSVTNLPNLVNLGISQQAVGTTLTFQSAASSGSSDAATMTFNGMTAGTVTYTSGTTNGLETLNIVSNTNENTVADIAMNGTTLTTVNVSGDAKFTHTASLDSNVTTVDASGSTGGVVFTQTNAGTFTFTGGSADDTIIMGSTYTSADTIDGAGGSDTLGGTTAVIGGTTSSQTKVSNIEKLRVSDAHTTAINVSHFGSITDVILDVGSNAGSVTNASSGINVSMGTKAGTSAGGGTFALTVSGSGTTDSATCTLNDAEQSGSVTFTGVETLNLVSNLDLDGSAADTGTAGTNRFAGTLVLTDTAATEKVVVTGTESMTITGAVTANEVDASGATEPLIMGAACTISGVTVTGGAGGDTLFGSAGNDIINGGAGADTINPLAGNDIVSGGAGADIFRQSAAAANGVDRQTISDFDDTVTTGDIFNFNSGVATLTGTNNFASSAAIQTHSTTGNLTVNAAAEVVLVTSATVTDLTSANSLNGTNLLTAVGGTITGAIVGQNDILICVADTNGNVGVYHASSANNAILNTEITLVAVLQGSNVTLANLVFNNFTNGA